MDAYTDENVLSISKSGGVTYGEKLNDENSPNNMEEQYQEGYTEQFVEEDREEDNYYGKESYPDSYYDDGKNNSNAKNVTGMMEEEADVKVGGARGGEGQEEEGGGYPIDMRYGNDLNKELLLNVDNKKKKNKYVNMFKKKGEKKNTDVKVKDIPYCSFNNLEDGDKEGNAVGEMHDEEEKNYGNNGDGNGEIKKNGKKKKKKMAEKSRKKKKDDETDDKKFSEVYNSIYENLRKKKEVKQSGEGGGGGGGGRGDGGSSSMGNIGMNGIDHYRGKNDFYEINYNSSDHINSLSSVHDDSLFNEDVLKKYIIGQVLNIIRTSFHWAVTSFFLFFMFDHFSVFYVYRLVSFLTLFLFTPISIYLVKKRNVKFFLIATNTVRLIIWGFCIPFLYTIYKDEIKKYYVNKIYEFLFTCLLILDNIQVNISNLIDIDNNGIDFISKKYNLKINEKAKRKFLTLHQFFFDASFIVVNPLIVFVMYLFSNLFSDSNLRDVFIYLSSFIFALITIITLVVYTTGLENAESMLQRNESNHNTNYLQSQNTADSLEDVLDEERGGGYNTGNDGEGGSEDEKGNGKTKGRVSTGAKENDFVGYYAKQDNSKRVNSVTYGSYPNIYSDQTKKYLTERSHNEYDDYVGGEENSLSDQYRKQFYEMLNNIMRIKNENMLLFYVCSLSYLNSVEDIMILMLIPLTSIFVCEFFYVNNIFVQILIAVILISLTKCFENISYYSNKRNIIALKDIFIGIILTGASLLFFFFPFLMINHLNIYSFLIFYSICCLFYFFFSTNLKTTLSLNLQKYVRESKSDIYNFVGLFMSFVNLIFVILTSIFLSELDNFVVNYVIICLFLIMLLGLLYAWASSTLRREGSRVGVLP
ncbi:hypothetical protein, conserved [Plasmodium ovale curtisi]|uniref:Uncharacterized protein n=1 Tax=Plasmodium ovale curtisi TaxID=864141 RepID=A0A1A8VU26_PLAOA|nr:hypothetical protein, conserved [Plasmodium ovale curtisi]